MEVTQKNFEAQRENFIKDLKDCDYVGFDLEMSGIKSEEQTYGYDLPFEYYMKTLPAAQKYGVIQIGFALFKKVETGVEARTYNFWTFPRPFFGKHARDVGLEPDCIEFHRTVGTNFQKWIFEGIGYFDQASLKHVEFQYASNSEKNLKEAPEITRDSDKKAFAKFCEIYDKWTAGGEKYFAYSERQPFLRMQYYRYIGTTTPTFSVETKEEGNRGYSKKIVVTRLTEDELVDFNAKLAEVKKQEFLDKAGFSVIWDEMRKAKKPLIGHNMLMDLLFTFDHFNYRLKQDYTQFKKDIHEYFPKIYDTKLLANDKMIESEEISSKLNLEDLYRTLKNTSETKIIIPEGFDDYNKDDGVFHEAGFDAFCTASAFTYLTERFGQTLLDNNVNLVRFYRSGLFYIDLANYENDFMIWEKGFIAIPLREVCKSKKEANEIQKKFVDIYGDYNSKVNVTLQGASHFVWGPKEKFWTMIITFDSDLLKEEEKIKTQIHEKIVELKLEGLPILGLKDYNFHTLSLWISTCRPD